MKLSEAVELGSTLIGEASNYFYHDEHNCGCFVAAAIVAEENEDYIKGLHAKTRLRFNATEKWIEEIHTRWPWTKEKVSSFPELEKLTKDVDFLLHNIADHLSVAHSCGTPRLELAQLCKIHEARLEASEVGEVNIHVCSSKG